MSSELEFTEKDLQMKVRQLAREKLRPIWREVDDVDGFSWDVVRLLSGEGLFRFCAPVEYQGAGLTTVPCCLIREELSRELVQADDTFLMSWSTGLMISTFGSDEQKKKYLPKLASGEVLGSGAITEPDAGSDVKAIKTTAKLDGDEWILNGEKAFSSNADVAEVTRVFVRTDLADKTDGFSYFLVDTKNKRPGLSCRLLKICAPHPCYTITFENLRVPKDSLLGELGQGLKIALTNLAKTRVTVGAAALGIAEAAYELALSYSRMRQAFGRPLVKFQATQFKLADMATEIEAGRLLVYRGAETADREGNTGKAIKQASMAKLYSTEMAQRVVDEAVQIYGAAGLVRGSRIEYLYRAVRALRIYEGTSEIQRLTITRQVLHELEKEEGGNT